MSIIAGARFIAISILQQRPLRFRLSVCCEHGRR
jgi:hypothetical protein